jgi:hypothetical protein
MITDLPPAETPKVGWVAFAVGALVLCGLETHGWMHQVPYWKRRLTLLPIEAATTAIVLWSWGLSVGVPLAVGVVAGLLLLEGGWALRTWIWQARVWNRVGYPRPWKGGAVPPAR